MGYTKIKAKIANPKAPEKHRDVEFLVDTGAIYTVVERGTLRQIGIESVDKMEFSSISNEKLIREVGVTTIEAMGRKWLTNVIFGEETDDQVLGVTTLEQLGLQADPVKQEIRPLPLYLL